MGCAPSRLPVRCAAREPTIATTIPDSDDVACPVRREGGTPCVLVTQKQKRIVTPYARFGRWACLSRIAVEKVRGIVLIRVQSYSKFGNGERHWEATGGKKRSVEELRLPECRPILMQDATNQQRSRCETLPTCHGCSCILGDVTSTLYHAHCVYNHMATVARVSLLFPFPSLFPFSLFRDS